MTSESDYPVEPMTAFFAAVKAVENGSIGEIELEFLKETPDFETVVSISVRRQPRPYVMLTTIPNQPES